MDAAQDGSTVELHFRGGVCTSPDSSVSAVAAEQATTTGDAGATEWHEWDERDMIIVSLNRHSFEACIPWGVRCSSDTMALLPPAKGSIAAEKAQLRGCSGFIRKVLRTRSWADLETAFPPFSAVARGGGDGASPHPSRTPWERRSKA
eukprot:gene56969-biopygen114562